MFHAANQGMPSQHMFLSSPCLHMVRCEDGRIVLLDTADSTEMVRQLRLEANHCERNYGLHRYVACDSTSMHIVSVLYS